MKLEDLAKPLDIADDFFHRGYSKLTTKWEDKGRSKYSLSGLCDFVSLPMSAFYFTFSLLGILLGPIIGISGATSIMGIIEGRHPTGVREENGKFIVDNINAYCFESFAKTIRTPELIAGIGFTGKGIFDIYAYFANNDSLHLSEVLEDLSLGVSFILNASAWFIRDSDPEVLDRKPLWKETYENLRDKIESPLIQPSPELVPIPIRPDRNYR